MFEVDGVACETWEEALTWARKFVDASPGARLVVAASMVPSVPRDFPNRSSMRQAKAVDASRALSLLRDLVATRRVVHDDTAGARRPGGGGAGPSGRRDRGVVVVAGGAVGSVAGGVVGVVGGANADARTRGALNPVSRLYGLCKGFSTG